MVEWPGNNVVDALRSANMKANPLTQFLVTQENKLAPYRAQIQARAVENNVFVAHANAPANADATGSHGQSRLIDPDGNLIKEASVFKEEIVTATLDLKLAHAGNARRSISRGPLGGWWKDGVKQVKQID